MHANEACIDVQIFRMMTQKHDKLPWLPENMHRYDRYMTRGFWKLLRLTLATISTDRLSAKTFRQRLIDHYTANPSFASTASDVPEDVLVQAEEGSSDFACRIADSARVLALGQQAAAPADATSNSDTAASPLHGWAPVHHNEPDDPESVASRYAATLPSVAEGQPSEPSEPVGEQTPNVFPAAEKQALYAKAALENCELYARLRYQKQFKEPAQRRAKEEAAAEEEEEYTGGESTRGQTRSFQAGRASPSRGTGGASTSRQTRCRQAGRASTRKPTQERSRTPKVVERFERLQDSMQHLAPPRHAYSMYANNPICVEAAPPPVCTGTARVAVPVIHPTAVKWGMLEPLFSTGNYVFPKSLASIASDSVTSATSTMSRLVRGRWPRAERAADLSQKAPTRMVDRVGELAWGFEGAPPPYSGVQEPYSGVELQETSSDAEA